MTRPHIAFVIITTTSNGMEAEREELMPIAPESVAALLAAAEKLLIRSNEDADDAVIAAVAGYAYRLADRSRHAREDSAGCTARLSDSAA
jgi:hypothetical protein